MLTKFNFKKIIINLIYGLTALAILGNLLRVYKKKSLSEAYRKNTIIFSSQASMKMAREGNIQYFKNRVELNEGFSKGDELGNSVVHEAVQYKNYDLVEYFISLKMSFNVRDKSYRYPIGVAASNCDDKMIELLRPVSHLDAKDGNGKNWKEYAKNCKLN